MSHSWQGPKCHSIMHIKGVGALGEKGAEIKKYKLAVTK